MWHPIRHFITITRHRHLVIYHCAKVGIFRQGLAHDLSKYTPTEFKEGAKFYQGDKSPTEMERKVYGYSKAWLHHKGRNRHHFEHWVDYNPDTRKMEPIKMPLKYVKEMFCDRLAAGKIYLGEKYTNDNPIEYFLRGTARDNMHPETAKLLEGWLRMIQSDGEEKTFAHIREVKEEDY